MKIQNLKGKAKAAVAATAVAVMSAPAMAEDSVLTQVTTELSGLKAEVLALGVVVVGISIAFAVMRIGKRGANSAG